MSTSYALTEVINEITSSLNNKMYSIGVFIDLKKAFDTVDHELLCEFFYGIRGVAHNWISSYLSNRSQFVCYNEFHSDLLNISRKRIPICLLQRIPLRPVKYITWCPTGLNFRAETVYTVY